MLALMEILYVTDVAHNRLSENLTQSCLHYITRLLRNSIFGTQINSVFNC